MILSIFTAQPGALRANTGRRTGGGRHKTLHSGARSGNHQLPGHSLRRGGPRGLCPEGIHPALSAGRVCGARRGGDLSFPRGGHAPRPAGNGDPRGGDRGHRHHKSAGNHHPLGQKNGRPIYNAIVWQCRRTASLCEAMIADGCEDYIRQNTGLRMTPISRQPRSSSCSTASLARGKGRAALRHGG